jgi:hypothetical protein
VLLSTVFSNIYMHDIMSKAYYILSVKDSKSLLLLHGGSLKMGHTDCEISIRSFLNPKEGTVRLLPEGGLMESSESLHFFQVIPKEPLLLCHGGGWARPLSQA